MLAEEIGFDDGLRDARYIFERKENESLCGARALADDDGAGGSDSLSIREFCQLLRGETRRSVVDGNA